MVSKKNHVNNEIERANVNMYLREAISLLLENRPENPILFLADQ